MMKISLACHVGRKSPQRFCLYYALLIDITVISTKVSAYVLVGIRLISEVGFIECVHFLRSRIPWLRCLQYSHMASTTK